MSTLLQKLSGDDIICALATVPGTSAIAVIRISGKGCISLVEKIYKPYKAGDDLSSAEGYTIHHGKIVYGDELVDEVLLSLFRSPHSYTGEDMIEIGIHGSVYIQQRILEILIASGSRMAEPGEFTLRGFLNGKFDLSQAEAVVDLIDSQSRSSHDLAIKQMRGGFSKTIAEIRSKLVNLASLMELELDFSEEDVQFADRGQLTVLIEEVLHEISQLKSSFTYGNVIKSGIPVAITGKSNVGKSTLLNAILNEEKAIVSEIPGTTRDYIEDRMVIRGVVFRFIDTAGLRRTSDYVENLGIERTYEQISNASIILYVFDVNETSAEELHEILEDLKAHAGEGKIFIPIVNKTDLLVDIPHRFTDLVNLDTIFISAKRKENINLVIEKLLESVDLNQSEDRSVVSNSRHFEALRKAGEALEEVKTGIETKKPTDLITTDLRKALHHLGEISGEVTTDEILSNIFGRFCIGK